MGNNVTYTACENCGREIVTVEYFDEDGDADPYEAEVVCPHCGMHNGDAEFHGNLPAYTRENYDQITRGYGDA